MQSQSRLWEEQCYRERKGLKWTRRGRGKKKKNRSEVIGEEGLNWVYPREERVKVETDSLVLINSERQGVKFVEHSHRWRGSG